MNSSDHAKICREIKVLKEQLSLIGERKTQYILPTDIPLELISSEREKQQRLDELEAQRREVEKSLPQGTSVVLPDPEIMEQSGIFKPSNDIDYLSVYQNIKEIIRLYDSKAKIEELGIFADSSNNIRFELYRTSRKTLRGTDIYYFLYLPSGTYIKPTAEFFKEKYSDVYNLHRRSLFILLPVEKHQKIPQRRLNNVHEVFNPKQTFYIDNFVWEECTNEVFKDELKSYEIPRFVDPLIGTGSDQAQSTATEYIRSWIHQENSSILLITGSGGVGKTTIAKRSANIFSNEEIKRALYIESNTLISHLSDSTNLSEDLNDLYVFYKAYCRSKDYEVGDPRIISKDLFWANLDNGNLTVIVDGIDEVIVRFGNSFDLDKFLSSIRNYCDNPGRSRLGKVIVSCRSQFLKDIALNISNEGSEKYRITEVIEVLPFDQDRAKKYFSAAFPGLPKTVQKGMEIANKLTGNPSEYLPFVLDIVVFILQDKIDGSGDLLDPSFDSEILTSKVENDYIVYKICYREERKYNISLTADQQIKFFVSLASDHSSCILIESIPSLLEKSLNVRDPIYAETLKAHPFLTETSSRDARKCAVFKYDFLAEYFEGVLISSLLATSGNSTLNEKTIEILGDRSRFNSGFVKTCYERLSRERDCDEFNLFIIELIGMIMSTVKKLIEDKPYMTEDERNRLRDKRGKAISGVFLIALNGLRSRNKENYTKLLKDIFGNNPVDGFCFCGVNEKIVFDFSDLTVTNSVISDYDFFWECSFNQASHFTNSKLSSLTLRSGVRTSASRNNFDLTSCKIDKSVEEALSSQSRRKKSQQIALSDDLRAFLRLFYSVGYMMPQKEVALRGQYGRIPTSNDYDTIIDLLLKHSFIEEHESEKSKKMGKEFKINPDHREDALKFISEGTMFTKIKEIILDMD